MDRVIDRARIILGVSGSHAVAEYPKPVRGDDTRPGPDDVRRIRYKNQSRPGTNRGSHPSQAERRRTDGLRIDGAARRVTTWATEAAVKHCGGDMGAFMRVWYRGAARRGGEYACLCPVLVRCAHALTQSPRTEVHVLLCCVMEAIATLQSASLADEA